MDSLSSLMSPTEVPHESFEASHRSSELPMGPIKVYHRSTELPTSWVPPIEFLHRS